MKGSYWGSKAAAVAEDKDDEVSGVEEDDDDVDTDDGDDSTGAPTLVLKPLLAERASLSRFLLSTSSFSSSSSRICPFNTEFFALTALLLCSSSDGELLAMALERILSDNVHRGQQNNTNITTIRLINVMLFRWTILLLPISSRAISS